MNNIFKSTLLTLSLFALVVSCDNDPEESGVGGDLPISINATITRSDASDDSTVGKSVFEHNDEISFFAWVGTLGYYNLVINNAIVRLNYDAWVTDSDLEWKNTTTSHTISAIYPATEEDNYQILTAMDYTSNTDMLYSTVTSVPQTEAIDLEFTHLMARLDIDLSYVGFDEDDTKASSIIISAIDDATINYYTGEVTTSNATKKDLDISFENSETLSRIMVPQTGINDIVINIDGKQYTYSGDDINLVANHYTKCNFTITKHVYDLSLGAVSVMPWSKNSGNDFDFSVEQ